MNKSGVVLVFVLGLIVLSGFVFAENCTSFNYSSWGSCTSGTQTRTVLNSTPVNCTGGNPVLIQNCSSSAASSTLNLSKIDKGFACLTEKVKSDCSGATTIQEIALTILASPSTVTQKCYDRLMTFKKAESCFGASSCNVRDTALAVLALNHVGQNTVAYQSWLKNTTITATDLIWYLEQDSNSKAGCKVSYDSADYSFNVLENKKIDGSAGNCLTPAQSNYWLQVSPACYDKTFSLVCDVDYIATLLYKQPNSPTIYVLSGTKSAQANQPVDLGIKALCFGTSGCDYEASAWATVALEATGNEIEAYIPYLIANEDANKRYLPEAFLQILKDFSEYGTKLIQEQELNSWEADNTAYNKYYDTSLALLALANSNQQQVVNARNWLTNVAPGTDGCWNNGNIRDTAIALWALASRSGTVSGGTTLVGCGESSFFCITTADCPDDQLLPNYYCSSLGKKCCRTENLQPCSDLGGKTCSSDKVCSGIVKRASDTQQCCMEECQTPETRNACELADGTCRSSCSSAQTEIDSACDESTFICCKTKAVVSESGGSYWWIWLLIVLIVIVVLAIVFRERLKVLLYKMKSGFKEDKGKPSGSGVPPGFGPYSSDKPAQQPPRPIMRPMPPQQQQRPPQAPINRLPIRR